jgi:hypothetical protein
MLCMKACIIVRVNYGSLRNAKMVSLSHPVCCPHMLGMHAQVRLAQLAQLPGQPRRALTVAAVREVFGRELWERAGALATAAAAAAATAAAHASSNAAQLN